MTVPAVTAIVANYQGAGLIEPAVASLLAQDWPALDVVVVDNGSTDGSAEAVVARFGERVRVDRVSTNLGWGGANNRGIRASSAPWVFVMNNDAEADVGCVRALVTAGETDPAVGMVAARVLEHGDRRRIDSVGHLMFPDGLNRGRGRGTIDSGQWAGTTTALFPSGAGALYRRAMFDEVGLFDETLFLYGDDAELGMRGRLAGWECALAHDAVVWHHYSRTAGAYSTLKAFHVERNRILVLLAFFPLSMILASPFHSAVRFALQAWGALSGRGAAARLAESTSLAHLGGVTLRAWTAAVRLAQHALATRRRMQRLRRLDDAAVRRLLAAHRLGARDVALRD